MNRRTLLLSLPLLAACASSPSPSPSPSPSATATPAPTSTATSTATPTPTPTSTSTPTSKPSAAPSFPAGSPSNELTLKMLRALKGEQGNVFLSGTSLRGALGMTAAGAKGKTRDEMVQALGLDPDVTKDAAAAKAERDAWKAAAGKAELTIANRLWVEKSFTMEKSFTDAAQSGWGASAQSLDFGTAPEPSRQKINTWVSDTTKGKIKDLLPQGSVTPLTRLVLTNAIYFKGNWVDAFPKKDTKDDAFEGAGNVPTMHRTGDMGYAENDEVRIVELKYKDSDLSMVVALPKTSAQMNEILGEVTGGEVEAWTKSIATRKIALSLPKFTFSWGRSVKPELEGLGMKTAFTDAADFSGIAPAKKAPLEISDVFHKAFVLVDETGTEAAAATGTVMATRAMSMPLEVKVDRPFLFFVRNTKTGEILFAGRVTNPKG